MLEFFSGNGRNEKIRIVGRPRSHRQNVALGWIDNHDGTAFCFGLQRFFCELLEPQIQRGDDIISGHRRFDHLLGSLAAVFVEREFIFAVLAGEQFVERLLEPVATFCFRPKRFVVVDDAVQIAARLSGITDDLSRDFAVWISPHVNRPHYQKIFRSILYPFVLRFAQVLRDLQRQNSAVVVMPKDRIV